jgi:hypothetical protein
VAQFLVLFSDFLDVVILDSRRVFDGFKQLFVDIMELDAD